MVKKHKGGRRPILQLEDKKPTRNEFEPTSSATATATATGNKEASPLDSQVADFFKEIDALIINERAEAGNSEAACASNEVASCSKQKDLEDLKSHDGLSGKSESGYAGLVQKGSYCPWQEICDGNTGYNYYWNTETNEVTWECPSEYIVHLKNIQADSEALTQSNQANSNDIHKKSKKKKEHQTQEGAIIPISYFGGSSSNESEDEKENGLSTSSKHCYKDPRTVGSKQKNSRKDEIHHFNDKKREPCVGTMGPHLPHDNHFTKKVSSASRTSLLSKETDISSKNEVDEYLEIGPQLASKSGVDLSKKTGCNTVSDSSSKCTNVSHSVKNGPTVASSTYEEPWEISLMNIDRKFRGLDPDIGEESPDSTVRKVDSVAENSVPCLTSIETFGRRGVVEYDNFTDEEEEMSSSSISSSKQEPVSVNKAVSFGYPKESENDGQKKLETNKVEVSQSESQRNLTKRKFYDKADEYENSNFKKSKQKDKVDIDSLFISHGNNGKYGFGFSRQEQLNLENEFYCSTSSHHQFGSSKSSNDFKAINFVKSEYLFDLSSLNKDVSGDNSSHSQPSGKELSKEVSSEKDISDENKNVSDENKNVIDKNKGVSNENKDVSNENKDVSNKNKNKDVSNKNKDVSNKNKDVSNENKHVSNENKDVSNGNIYAPGPSGLNGIKEIAGSKDTISNESSYAQNSDLVSKEKGTEVANSSKLNLVDSKLCSSSEKKEQAPGQKDISSSRVNNYYKIEEDIDEIDRALCEALEAKKAEIAVSKPSSSSSSSNSVASNSKKYEMDSSIKPVSNQISIESAKSASNNGKLSEDIISLSSVLLDKLTFLVTNHSTLSSLSSLLIQLQTRLLDWQSGSLESKYYFARLQELQQYLQHYEVGSVTSDWTCQWDRENKRYFYMNNRTQQPQWTYPEELCGKENSWMPSSTAIASTSTASSQITTERDELQTVSSSVPEGRLHSKLSISFTAVSSKGMCEKYSNSSVMWMSQSSPPPPPPGVDSPPPPPPHSPPPVSPPPPPPDSTEVEHVPEDMDIENSDDSNPPLIVTNSRADMPADAPMQYPKFGFPPPERSSETFTNTSIANAVSSTSLSSFEDMNTVSKSPQLVSTSRDTFDTADSVNMHWSMSQPSCSSDIGSNFDSESEAVVLSDHKLLSSDKDNIYKDSDANASSSNRNLVCSNEVSTYRKPCSPYPSTSASASRKEKKKAKLSSGLALKKKNIPSLVEKWQKIKEEQDKEDKNSEDPRNSNSF